MQRFIRKGIRVGKRAVQLSGVILFAINMSGCELVIFAHAMACPPCGKRTTVSPPGEVESLNDTDWTIIKEPPDKPKRSAD